MGQPQPGGEGEEEEPDKFRVLSFEFRASSSEEEAVSLPPAASGQLPIAHFVRQNKLNAKNTAVQMWGLAWMACCHQLAEKARVKAAKRAAAMGRLRD